MSAATAQPLPGEHPTPLLTQARPAEPTAPQPERRRRKLIIQIPCYNEAGTLGVTLRDLPRQVPGFDDVEWLIIDDGSSDGTARVAKRLTVDHIVRLPRNQGLARAFMAGLDACLQAGADVIVNTDADNQYQADDIPLLVQPILDGRADIVVGARPILSVEHFSPLKKALQRLGSYVVRKASQTNVADAPSGFRAFSREAAMRLHVFGSYTYTIETIIQAGRSRMAVLSVPIRVNGDLRPSRLVRSIRSYVWRSMTTILRVYATYEPLKFFTLAALGLGVIGLALAGRYLCLWAMGDGAGHLQSVILSEFFLCAAVFVGLIGVVADLIAVNRKLLERIEERLRRLDHGRPSDANPAEGACPGRQREGRA